MNYMEQYDIWKQDAFFDEMTRKELASLDPKKDKEEIENRFCCNLGYNTEGMLGIMGAGTNRMNKYTIGRATKGFGEFLTETFGIDLCAQRGVVIGYDTRNNSHFYAKCAADVLSSMGIRVYLHTHARPAPQLSFSVKFWGAVAGIMITAGNKSGEYNGYQIFDEYGSRPVPEQAKKIAAYMDKITDYHAIDFSGNAALVEMADVTDNYIGAILKQSRYKNLSAKKDIHIVYTPLHGTGNVPMQKTLRLAGFGHVDSVEEQVKPEGDFTTITRPDLENAETMEIGILQAGRSGADIVLGTEPDGTGVGVAVRTTTGYELMSGNQVGVLLTDFIAQNTHFPADVRPVIVVCNEASKLCAVIARKKGITVFSTLRGFEYIGEKITDFEKAKKNATDAPVLHFVFGYGEPNGYLAGTHAQDADAIVAGLLICEMAAKLKAEGKTLLDHMKEIEEEYGDCTDATDGIAF